MSDEDAPDEDAPDEDAPAAAMRLCLNRVDATPVGAELTDDDLARLYAYPSAAELSETGVALTTVASDNSAGNSAWVRANMVSTLDGAAAGDDGRSGSINTGADRRVFALLRGLADVILVGAGTARTERYRRPKPADPALRAGRPAAPALALVSRSAVLPDRLAAELSGRDVAPATPDADNSVLLVTSAAAPPEALAAARGLLGEDAVLVAGDDDVDLAAALEWLTGRGLTRVLCEGGPHLLADLAAAGLLDELCLTLAPTLVGGARPRILAGDGVDVPLAPRLLVEADGTLLGRWTR